VPFFRYEVVDKSGRTLTGTMDAGSEADVRERLAAEGYRVKLILAPPMPVSTKPRDAAVPGPRPRSAAAPAKEMAVFFRQLASLIHAGVGMHEALAQINQQTPNRGLRNISSRAAERVDAGERLSQAMEEFPRAFPPHVVGVVAAGELGGFLPIVLGDIALDYEIEQRASVRWIRWVQWTLWIQTLGVILLMPVMPLLPWIATEGMGVYYAFVLKYLVPPLVAVIVVLVVARAILRRPSMRTAVHSLLLKVPTLGRASRERSLANFTRMLWRLQSAGILPVQAWETASRAANNVVVAGRLRDQLGAIRSGARFSAAMNATGLFRNEDERILATGEASGQVADILQRMASYYEDSAMTAAGRARWLGLRIAILAYIVAFGAVVICAEGFYILNVLKLVEQEFEPSLWLPLGTR